MRCTPIDPFLGAGCESGKTRADLSALRILLLDDDPIQRVLYTTMFQAALPFDVVVTDLKMAGMDGIEFMRRAVKWPVRGVILMSVLEPELLECAASVARGYGATLLGTLPKPFTSAQLRQLPARPARQQPTA
ncbi:MAG: hypothetical protein H7Z39_12505, partial [Burkholderiaceae bacterium]|nr:hypothetical protein [Burkholderiaceae bacterium]